MLLGSAKECCLQVLFGVVIERGDDILLLLSLTRCSSSLFVSLVLVVATNLRALFVVKSEELGLIDVFCGSKDDGLARTG